MWVAYYPNDFVHYDAYTCSDHAPMILDTLQIRQHKPPRFRFQNAWTNDPATQKIINKHWHRKYSRSHIYNITRNLPFIKQDLKIWAKKNYHHIHQKLNQNHSRLLNVQQQLIQFPSHPYIEQHLDRLVRQRERLLAFTQNYWGKYSRKQWMTKGDRNTSFFHSKIKTKIKPQQILRIRNQFNEWVDSPYDVQNAFIYEFQERFKFAHQYPRAISLPYISTEVSDTDNCQLHHLSQTKKLEMLYLA